MAETKNMPFARNLKIIMHHSHTAVSKGVVLKADGNWRYIRWSNEVQTWHRVEQLKEKATRTVEVVRKLRTVEASEIKPKATKPRPAPKRLSVEEASVKVSEEYGDALKELGNN